MRLVDDIQDFLRKEDHTDPANILKIAKEVLDIKMPDESEIERIKEPIYKMFFHYFTNFSR